MTRRPMRHLCLPILLAVFSVLVVALFAVWVELNPETLHKMVQEGKPIENATAALFGLASVCFIVFAWRSEFLRAGRKRRLYTATIAWALLMFIFMGEEISWGQVFFDIVTPATLTEINAQDETNIHNIEFINTFLGGKYRWLSIMMLTTGLLLPLFALSNIGKRIIQRTAFPVAPLCYAPLFVGAYMFGRHYDAQIGNNAAEVREFLMAVSMFSFALHGALSPGSLFRVCDPKDKNH